MQMRAPMQDFQDPITLQVMWNRLVFIADQADNVLGRTAFSPIVRENHDYVTVLMDSRGRALSQCTWSIPVFISSLPAAVQNHFLKAFPPETLKPGDVLATNDADIGTGHLLDVTMVTPIFKNGKVVAYAGSIAHMPDIGGRPLSPDATDIFEEGIRFPMMKMHREGEPNRDMLDIIAASVRLPYEVMGDLESMVAANAVMARELERFLDDYDLDEVDILADAIHSRSEARMRQAISALPDGVYKSEVMLDGFDDDVHLKVAVEVKDDTVHVDYAGTSDQVLHGINCRPNYRFAHSVYAIKCLLDPGTPNNEGCINPITDSAPLGSILNPRASAAGNSRNLVGHVIPSAIFRAMQEILPERVIGDSGGAPIWATNCMGQHADGTSYGSMQYYHGGQGGRATLDGLDALSFPSNCKATPVEMFELAVPVLTECKELIRDSGGIGKYRGGMGQRSILRNLSPLPMSIYVSSERVKYPCFGVVGGQDGRPGQVLKNGEPHFPKGKIRLDPGDRLTMESPGGGGWGDPAERPVADIEGDLSEGWVTQAASRKAYPHWKPE